MKSAQMKEIYKDGSPRRKEVECVDDQGKVVEKFRSLRQASKKIGLSPSTMCYAIRDQKLINGYHWRYKENEKGNAEAVL